MTDQPRYTREQVLAGIRCYVETVWGGSPEFDESTELHDYFYSTKSDLDDLCPLELLEDLSKYFGFHWGQARWGVWLSLPRSDEALSPRCSCREEERVEKLRADTWQREVAPTLTFGRLADTIARRAPAPSFAPITVFGSRCEPAGVFTGLKNLPELKGKRVAPSTRLLDVLSPFDVRDYFARVGWTTGVTPPPCYEYRLFGAGRADQNTATLAVLLVTLASLAELGSALDGIGFWGLVLRVAIWLVAAMTVHTALINRLGNPLPTDMQTFADLARRIASKREAAT